MKSSEVRKQCLGCGVDFVSQKYRNRKFHNRECYLRFGKIIIPKETLYQKYIIEKKSLKKISKELNIDHQTIWNRLKEFNIPIRTHSQASRWQNTNTDYRKKWSELTSKNTKKLWQKPEFRKKLKEIFQNPEHKRKLSEAQKKVWQNPEFKKRQSEIFKKRWKTLEFREKTIKATMKAQHRKPNQKEIILGDIIKSLSPDYIFVGDGGKFSNVEPTVINGRVPDFINVNGQKKAINFNGIYWHLQIKQKNNPNLTKEQVEEMEKEPYKKLGWDLLIIWEDELKDKEEVFHKIKSFVEESSENNLMLMEV